MDIVAKILLEAVKTVGIAGCIAFLWLISLAGGNRIGHTPVSPSSTPYLSSTETVFIVALVLVAAYRIIEAL